MISGTHSNLIDFPIVNDGFFPDLNLKDFQEIMRIKADLAPELMIRCLMAAMFYVNKELDDYKDSQVAAAYSKLEDVPQASLGDGEDEKKEFVFHYETAVYNYAAGDLHPELVSISRRDEASKYMETIKENRQEYYNDANDSIRRVLGTRKSKSNSSVSSALIGDE